MKITINKDTCIGCGTCPALCPEVFELDENFKARVKDGADLNSPNIKMAAESCPVEAIEIEE
ncbi:MAG: ferredoxin [bacterium]